MTNEQMQQEANVPRTPGANAENVGTTFLVRRLSCPSRARREAPNIAALLGVETGYGGVTGLTCGCCCGIDCLLARHDHRGLNRFAKLEQAHAAPTAL